MQIVTYISLITNYEIALSQLHLALGLGLASGTSLFNKIEHLLSPLMTSYPTSKGFDSFRKYHLFIPKPTKLLEYADDVVTYHHLRRSADGVRIAK